MADSWLNISGSLENVLTFDFCHTASGAYSRHGRTEMLSRVILKHFFI